MRIGSSSAGDDPEINLIPLIDVLFCLILFLVVSTTFTQRSAMNLRLPQAQVSASPDAGSPLIVLVDAEGKFFVGNNEILKTDVASLKQAIAQAAGDNRAQPVVLRADGRTPHQFVVNAMDALGQLGFTKLSIATTPEPKSHGR